MIFITYQTAEAFLQRTRKTLLVEEASNNLLLGLCLSMKNHPDRIQTQPYFATVADDDELVTACLMTPPHNLIVYSTRLDCASAFHLVAENLITNGWQIPGVIGPVVASNTFAEEWSLLTDREYQLSRNERIYELRKVVLPAPVSGHLRLAEARDEELLGQWTTAFNNEALGEGDPEEARQNVRHRIADHALYVWDDGRPVSTAAVTRATLHGITVSMVYTPPEFRRRGYASSCVAALSQRMLDAGWKFCTLFTDLANPTSNDIYQRIGYTPIGDFDEYTFEISMNERLKNP